MRFGSCLDILCCVFEIDVLVLMLFLIGVFFFLISWVFLVVFCVDRCSILWVLIWLVWCCVFIVVWIVWLMSNGLILRYWRRWCFGSCLILMCVFCSIVMIIILIIVWFGCVIFLIMLLMDRLSEYWVSVLVIVFVIIFVVWCSCVYWFLKDLMCLWLGVLMICVLFGKMFGCCLSCVMILILCRLNDVVWWCCLLVNGFGCLRWSGCCLVSGCVLLFCDMLCLCGLLVYFFCGWVVVVCFFVDCLL